MSVLWTQWKRAAMLFCQKCNIPVAENQRYQVVVDGNKVCGIVCWDCANVEGLMDAVGKDSPVTLTGPLQSSNVYDVEEMARQLSFRDPFIRKPSK